MMPGPQPVHHVSSLVLQLRRAIAFLEKQSKKKGLIPPYFSAKVRVIYTYVKKGGKGLFSLQ